MGCTYKKGDSAMYLKRTIYNRLVEWKNDTDHSTLEINGARQVGKTYIINKFADEQFHHKIYINLFEQSGKQFQKCLRQATVWEPGAKRPQHPLHDAFQLFEPDFTDSTDTVIIIDEIQESAEIYNCIREFTRHFQAHFIITGSYLGQILAPEFRYASGDLTRIVIYTLSFEEFLQAYDEALYRQYLSLPSAPSQDDALHKGLKTAYDIYLQIGGYPNVVKTYLEKRSIEKARGALIKIIDTFTNESTRYFTDILDTSVFTQIFLSVCRILSRESRGLEDSISEELQKLVTRDYSSNITKAVCNRAISWLYFSGILGFCAKITEMDILDFKPACRCYFMDTGLASYYLSLTGLDSRSVAGTLNENYVYINLKKRQDFPEEIAFETPAFATYRGGEIDFIAQSIRSSTRYLVEVKSGKGTAATALKALEHGKAHRLLYLKGDTKGGIDDKIETLPIYLLERYQFI